MTENRKHRPRRFPSLPRRQRVRLDRDEAVLRGTRCLRGGRWQLHRHRRHVLLLGAGPRGGRVGDDPRPVDGRAANRDRMVVATRWESWGAWTPLGEDRSVRPPELSPPSRDRPDRPLLRPRRRPEDPPGGNLGAFDALVREGKVLHVAASNYTEPRLSEALAVSDARASPASWRSSRTTTSSTGPSRGALAALCPARGSRVSRTTRSPAASSPASTGRA